MTIIIPNQGDIMRRLFIPVLLSLGLSLAASSGASPTRAGNLPWCPTGWLCVGGPTGPVMQVHWSNHGAVLDGYGWPHSSRVTLRFVQHVNFPRQTSRSTYPAVTGLIVRSNSRGRFKMVLPALGPCNFLADVTASAPRASSLTLKPHAFCMETPSPNPPIEKFRVSVGRYIHAIYRRNHVHARYSLALPRGGAWSHPLARRAAMAIARKTAHVGPRARAITFHGTIGVGLAGIGTEVWEVWVNNRVPHWGHGQEVLLIVMATQKGVSMEHRGQVLATWFAP
jgi:hypothetical protein